MHFSALASDYDGTLATNGELRSTTAMALIRLAESGRKVILVTGRTMEELRIADVDRNLFDAVVVENGALVWDRATGKQTLLADPIDDETVAVMEARGVTPLHVGRVIASTHTDQAATLQGIVDDLNLPLRLCPNKHSLMLLPNDVDKATGLQVALDLLGGSLEATVGCGDAENDIPMIDACGCGVAVANSVDELKRRATIVTRAERGEGVEEVIEALIADDLASVIGERAVRAG